MTLGQKQELFMTLLAQLLSYAEDLGYGVRGKELWRTEASARWNASHCGVVIGGKRCTKFKGDHGRTIFDHDFKAIGIVKSLHRLSLAIDLVLSKNGDVTWEFADYKRLGDFWKSLNQLCCWGGDFGDAGHFSLSHQGRK